MTTAQRIVVLGTHGQNNIGDELLLDTFLDQLGRDHHYVVNSYDPALTRARLADRFDVEVIDTAADRIALVRHLWRADRLVFAGGSIVKELYASVGRNRYSTMLMIAAIVTYARWVARVPTAMLNIGVGPIMTANGRRLARRILSQVDLVTVRDAASYALCRGVGVKPGKVELATDASFVNAPEWFDGPTGATTHDRSEASSSDGVGPLKIALNMNFDIKNPQNWEYFTEHLAAILSRLADRHDIEIHLLPMQEGFKDRDDVQILDEFSATVHGAAIVRHRVADQFDVADILRSCDLLISERLHAIAIASIVGTPSFVLAYDVKVDALAATLGLGEFTIDINERFGVDDAEDRLDRLIRDRAEVGRALTEKTGELRRAATADFAKIHKWIVADGET